jgi:hypothetical protein
LSGNGNNGTLINGVAYTDTYKGIMTFDGVNDYVDCGTASYLNNSMTGLTVSIWYRVNTNRTEIIAENGTNFTTNTFYIAHEDAFNLSFEVANDLGQYSRIYGGPSPYVVGAWYNFVGVWSSGNSLLAYINGQNASREPLNPYGNLTSLRSGNANLFLCRRPGGALYSSGILPIFQIYNRALSATEIQQNFNAIRGRYGL